MKKILFPTKLTKTITTIGPSSADINVLRELFLNGSTVIRLNFSHGTHDEQYDKVLLGRKLTREFSRPFSIMVDTKGPEIRTHEFQNNEVEILKGTLIKIYYKKQIIGTNKEFSVTYSKINLDVSKDSLILLDDGKLRLKVENIFPTHGYLTALALNSAKIKSRRGVNLPGAKLSIDFLSKKDKEDLLFACQHKVDYVAASFVRNAADVKLIRDLLDANGGKHIQIISKIECDEATRKYDEILDKSDGIMLARGDLGIEVNIEKLPVLQSVFARKCWQANKPFIIATQMLDSMIKNPLPTRAEVSDIYLAVRQKASSTMLSGESANGLYPVLCMSMMSKVICETEKYFLSDYRRNEYLKVNEMYADNTLEKRIISYLLDKTNKISFVYLKQPSRSIISRISSLYLGVPVFVVVNDCHEYTAYGIYYGINPILETDFLKLGIKSCFAINPLLGRKYLEVENSSITIKHA